MKPVAVKFRAERGTTTLRSTHLLLLHCVVGGRSIGCRPPAPDRRGDSPRSVHRNGPFSSRKPTYCGWRRPQVVRLLLATSACRACEEGGNMTVVIYGPAYRYPTPVRCGCAEEKRVAYRLQEVDTLGGEGQKPEHLARYPWGKVQVAGTRRRLPVRDSGRHPLRERRLPWTIATARRCPTTNANGTNLCGARQLRLVTDGDRHFRAARLRADAIPPNAVPIAEALPQAEACWPQSTGGGDFQCGETISIADFHLIPSPTISRGADDGRAGAERSLRLSAWRRRIERKQRRWAGDCCRSSCMTSAAGSAGR